MYLRVFEAGNACRTTGLNGHSLIPIVTLSMPHPHLIPLKGPKPVVRQTVSFPKYILMYLRVFEAGNACRTTGLNGHSLIPIVTLSRPHPIIPPSKVLNQSSDKRFLFQIIF